MSQKIVPEVCDEYTLGQARWSEHRKKIGLSKLIGTNKNSEGDNINRRQEKLIEFVKNTFKHKECMNFVPNPKKKVDDSGNARCHCGEIEAEHKPNQSTSDLNSDESTSQVWTKEKCIEKVAANSFGAIDFVHESLGVKKASKYLRIADDTPIDDVLEFFSTYWHMDKPRKANLAITVIGGAKNFKLDGKKKETFNRGLVNAAQTTNAWIITSGCNMGVMRAVGEAVREGQSFNWDKHGATHLLRCIGIAPWGYIERKKKLIGIEKRGSWNASYRVNNVVHSGQPVPLNQNHTHFLLIDDGFRGKYQGVAEFRSLLEKKISLPVDGEEKGLGIPVVLVVVEGGYDAIEDVENSLKQKIPVVICSGTGRAADIIAEAYRYQTTIINKSPKSMQEDYTTILQGIVSEQLLKAFGETWRKRGETEKQLEKIRKIVMGFCKIKNLITVFDMDKQGDLEHSILSALLKGQGNSDQLLDRLELALTWNRSDIAEEKIFNETGVLIPSDKLEGVLTKSLLEDKVDFVRLLLQNGVVMKEYLTVPRLIDLYNEVPKQSHLYKLLKARKKDKAKDTDKFCLKDVSRLLHKLMNKHSEKEYQSDQDRRHDSVNTEDTFQKPFRELFLWAVLMNRSRLAKFMWERGDEAIPTALVASKIFESLANELQHYDSDLKKSYLKNKDDFEDLAVKLLRECHNVDPEKAAMLVERKYDTWATKNCLELAAEAHDREFLSTVCCQNSLNLMWKRGIDSHSFRVVVALICPLFIFSIRFQQMGNEKESFTPWQKVKAFYRAPITKFSAHVILYILFLVLYSYVIMFDFKLHISWSEAVIIGWLVSVLLEEIREMFFMSTATSVKERLKDWWNFSVFNRLDLLILVIAFVGIILRVFHVTYLAGRTVYCINCVFLFIRIFRVYSASSYLGPKLVMIFRMMQELLLYIMIFLVFLLAYGISTRALMHPSQEPYLLIFRDIFYYPYWQIYGELFLDELEGRQDECRATRVNGTYIFMENGSPCPTYNWLVPALTAVYLLIGNVLLMNLLISIFTHVFEEIQVYSLQIWKYGVYFLTVDYDSKPVLAPPFVIIEYIYLSLRWMFSKTCCQENVKTEQYTKKHKRLLQVFEKEMLNNYLRKMKEKPLVESYIHKISDRVEEITKMLEEDRLFEQQYTKLEKVNLGGPEKIARKRISRWPTLERVKEYVRLAQKVEPEKNIDTNDEDDTSMSGRDSPLHRSNDFNKTSDYISDKIQLPSTGLKESKEEGNGNQLPTKKVKDFVDTSDMDDIQTCNKSEDCGKGNDVKRKKMVKHKKHKKRHRIEDQSLGDEEESTPITEAMKISHSEKNSIEQKLAQIEENTTLRLYNIEAMLRNQLFYRGQAGPSTIPPSRRPAPGNHHQVPPGTNPNQGQQHNKGGLLPPLRRGNPDDFSH